MHFDEPALALRAGDRKAQCAAKAHAPVPRERRKGLQALGGNWRIRSTCEQVQMKTRLKAGVEF